MITGISVVICCYNSEKRIPKVLTHLLEQVFDAEVKWEVLIVDNASTDNTKEVARRLWNHPQVILRTTDESMPGLSNARRRGFEESDYNIISFIDDDNWVEEFWVQKVYNHMNANSNIGILGGRGIGYFEEEPPFWFPDFEYSYALGPQAKESGRHYTLLYGAGMNIRKDAWEHLKSNGFEFILSDRKGNMITSGGDAELCLAVLLAGYELHYDQDLTFGHYMPKVRMGWNYLVKLHKSFGRATTVINIYFSFFREQGIKRKKYQIGWLSLLNTFYCYLKDLSEYARSGFSRKEGNRAYISFVDSRYSLKEIFRLFPNYRSIVKKIRIAEWRSNQLKHV